MLGRRTGCILAPSKDGRRMVMATKTTAGMGALTHELGARMESTTTASADAVYAALADVRTHAVWAGERQAKATRLVEIRAEQTPAVVGTEFTSVGTDPMGRFEDRSVVTEAVPGRLFGFVTEARLTTKKGTRADWTVVHRYELEPVGEDGCRVTYTYRVVRLTALPGMLALFNVPGLSRILMKISARVAKRGFRNLTRFAEERAAA
jgi:hypothetical protein